MGIVDRDTSRKQTAELRRTAAKRPFPFRLALLVGVFGTLLAGSILRGKPAIISTATAARADNTKGWRKWVRDSLGDGLPVAREFAIRMIFTAVFWLAAALLADMFDGKNLAAPRLMPALIGFFKEQIDLSMVLFQLLVLGLVALPALFFARSWQREIKREAFRLYYTISAVGGSLSLVATHPTRAAVFYGIGMVVPWLFVRLEVLDLD